MSAAAWPVSDRAACARRIQAVRDDVARAATEAFLATYPDWLARYGQAARIKGAQDAGFHVDFLVGAIEAGEPTAFGDYARWCGRVLEARGMARAFLATHLRQVRDALCDALPECSTRITTFVDAGVGVLERPQPRCPEPGTDGALAEVRRLFTRAAVRGDRRAAVGIAMEAVRAGTPLIELYERVFEPSQVDVGRRWEANELSVAEEHVATAVTQYAMARVFGEARPPAPARGQAIVSGVEGERHQIGGHMVADVLALDGWDVQFLGTDLPERDILREIVRVRPALLAVSVTMLYNLPKVSSLVRALSDALPDDRPRIIAGGAALTHASALAEEIGCDAIGTSLASARALAALDRPRTDG